MANLKVQKKDFATPPQARLGDTEMGRLLLKIITTVNDGEIRKMVNLK